MKHSQKLREYFQWPFWGEIAQDATNETGAIIRPFNHIPERVRARKRRVSVRPAGCVTALPNVGFFCVYLSTRPTQRWPPGWVVGAVQCVHLDVWTHTPLPLCAHPPPPSPQPIRLHIELRYLKISPVKKGGKILALCGGGIQRERDEEAMDQTSRSPLDFYRTLHWKADLFFSFCSSTTDCTDTHTHTHRSHESLCSHTCPLCVSHVLVSLPINKLSALLYLRDHDHVNL